MLHLADRPTDTMRLDMLAKRLARRAKSEAGPQRRPLSFQTRPARGLLWSSGALLALALGLLGPGYSLGILLLLPAVLYGAVYYLGQTDTELTA